MRREATARLDTISGGAPVPPLNRMGVAVLALAGMFVAIYMLLFSVGVLGSVFCGPGGGCDVVQTSSWAVFLGLPVPLWGVVGYGLILAVAVAGLRPRWLRDRRLAALLLGLSAAAFAFSGYLTVLEAFVIEAWCRWCVASALLATGIFGLALPELGRLRAGVGPGARFAAAAPTGRTESRPGRVDADDVQPARGRGSGTGIRAIPEVRR